MVHRRQKPTIARLTALAVLLAIVSLAPADESAVRAEVDALVSRLGKALDHKQHEELGKALGEVAPLHNKTKNNSFRAKLRVALWRVLDHTDSDEIFKAGLDSLAALNHPMGAFSRMRDHLPGKRDKELTTRGKAVLAALARKPMNGAISSLQSLAKSARSGEVRAAAIVTLGHFGASSKRVSIAKFLLTRLDKLSLGKTHLLQGPWLTAWIETGPPLLEALQQLTGQNRADPGPWLAAYKRDRKNLDALFDPAHKLPSSDEPSVPPWKATRARLAQPRGPTLAAIEGALRWLAAHQSPNGRFKAKGFVEHCKQGPHPAGSGEDPCDVGVTGLALNAFLVAGYDGSGEHAFDKTVRQGLAWLASVQDDKGFFGRKDRCKSGHMQWTPGRLWLPGRPRPPKPPPPRVVDGGHAFPYNHAIATLALVEAAGLTEDAEILQQAQRGLDYIYKARNPRLAWRYKFRGGENDTSITTWTILAVCCARMINGAYIRANQSPPFRVDELAVDGARYWFDKMTDPEFGQVGYLQAGGASARSGRGGGVLLDRFPLEKSQAMTAAAMLGRMLTGEDPAHSPMIKKGAALCLEVPPTWNPEDGSIDMIYWHFGALALHSMGGHERARWEPALRKALLQNQHKCSEGCCQVGSWPPIGAWGGEGGTVYATALNALTLLTPQRFPAWSK